MSSAVSERSRSLIRRMPVCGRSMSIGARSPSAAGGLPSLQSFDPLHLPRLLPNAWILEVDPETHRFRMRLAGEDINAIYGRSIAGQYFRDIFEASTWWPVAHAAPGTHRRRVCSPAARSMPPPAGSRGRAAGPADAGALRRDRHAAGRHRLSDPVLNQAKPVRISGDQPHFHRIRAANHSAPEIAGGTRQILPRPRRGRRQRRCRR